MLDIASKGLLFTIYYPIGQSGMSINNLLAGIGTFLGFFLGYRIAPRNLIHKRMRNFSYAIIILLFVATITSYLLPVTILVQMQIYRAGVFMLYFGMLYLGYFIFRKYVDGLSGKIGFLLLALGFIFFLFPLFTILLWFLIKFFNNRDWNTIWLALLIIGIQSMTIIIALQSGFWQPGIFLYGPQSDWRQVQEWAGNKTAIDAKFISPPHLFGHYTPDWRVFSERSSVVTIPEMMEIPFDPDFMDNFLYRFESVVPDGLQQFNGNYIQTLEITKEAFYSNTSEDFSSLGCQFSADYLVVEDNFPYDFQSVYQNEGFIIYKLPGCP
jgi:hypothetical protein